MRTPSLYGRFSGLCVSLMLLTACLQDPGPELPTLQETMQNNAQYGQMVEALQAADLWNELDGSLFVTFFAPSNAAWDTFLLENNLDKIGDLDKDSLNNLISYHIQYGKVFEADFVSNYLTTPAGGPNNAPVVFLMELKNSGTEINNLAKVTSTDTEADDGVLHTIDKVLYPPTVMGILDQNPEFSDFVAMVEKGGMREIIEEEGPWTLFAPPNSVMEQFFDTQPVGIDDVDDLSAEVCENMVRFALIPAQHRFEDLAGNIIPVDYETLLDDETFRIFE
ncbi:MAG: fasciclin domain-containing protein, partial [Bacteroidota bacterium]